jgi:acyl carrier protein
MQQPMRVTPSRPAVNVEAEVITVLDRVLNLKGRTTGFRADTPLLGAIPELDSMAVVTVITSLEERFGFAVDDDEIDGSTFATVGALVDFVAGKLKS